ncbi:MAG: SIMPL domain-containing protein [Chloroflexi bacterium]|nr:SIMPL domain-containing protein [Chloroflexota bacterium]
MTNKLKRTVLLTTLVLLAGLLGWGCTRVEPVPGQATYPGVRDQGQTGIWVSGQGEVFVVPDIVQLSLGVSAQTRTVAEAQRQAREAMDKVMTVLRSQGVAEKDIQTQSFRIEQVTRFDPRTNTSEITGYRVSNILSVKIRKIADAGKIIDATAEAGGNLTRINSIGFAVDDPKPHIVQARDKAMEDAIAKADQLARGAKVKLGRAVFISEGGASPPPPVPFAPALRAEAGAAPPTEILPGELKISLSVQVHFAIE